MRNINSPFWRFLRNAAVTGLGLLVLGTLVRGQAVKPSVTDEPETAPLNRLFGLREKVRDLHPLLAKLYPVAVAKDKTLRIFTPDEAAKTYVLSKTVPEPFPIPEGIRAAFPLEALGGGPACVVTPEVFTQADGFVFILHEFVHCGQWATVEDKLKETLGLYRRAMEKKDYMWELQHPFPYDDARFVAAYGAMFAALRSGDGAGVRRSRTELAGLLSADDFDYMTWQEWKEGLARHIENAVRARVGLPPNNGGLERPYTRVTFYAGGDRLIGFLAQADTQVPADLERTFAALRSIQVPRP
ncbi:MAG TPA: hypothetical protein VLN41_01185 [Candidatus Bathyarchaeia archaeon]|nr:hypothetical protein [Candidatus Bathyarchaeia archaeon]